MESQDNKKDAIEVIKNEIENLSHNIDHYTQTLNTQGIWLFIVTLGCWSVDQLAYQMVAFSISVIIFGHRFYGALKEKRPFNKVKKEIEKSIKNTLLEDDSKKARLFELRELSDEKLRVTKLIPATSIFILCYIFLVLSMVNRGFFV